MTTVDAPHVGLYRRATAAALVIASALFLLDNIIHPTEYERDNEARQLAEIAAHCRPLAARPRARVRLDHRVRRRRARAWPSSCAAASRGWGCGRAPSVAGLLGLAAVITIDGYTWGVLGEVYQRRGVAPGTAEIALHEVQQSEWSLVYYLTPLPGSSGWRCSRSAPRARARCPPGPACCSRSAA